MARISDVFSPLIAAECPGASEVEIRRAVVAAARDFFTRTSAWQTTVPATTTPNSSELSVDVPAGGELVRVLYVGAGQSKLRLVATEEVTLPAALSEEGFDPPTGMPTAAFFGSALSETLLLYPIPDKAYPAVIRACFMPTRTTEVLADSLLQFVEDITYGAKARLMATSNTSYSSPMYKWNEVEFERAVAAARWQAVTGTAKTSLAVAPRRFV